MQEAERIMADVHERVGSLEQEVHTLKHQVLQFERIPPRVSELERAFEGLSYLRSDQVEIKAGLKEVMASQQHMAGDIQGFGRAIKWVVGVMGLAAMATAAVVWILVR